MDYRMSSVLIVIIGIVNSFFLTKVVNRYLKIDEISDMCDKVNHVNNYSKCASTRKEMLD